MKKTIVSLAVLLASTFSISTFAQAPATSCDAAGCPTEKAECVQSFLFEGITLTPEQQTKLQELNASRAKAAKEKKEAAKADRKAKGDQKKAARKDYLNSVKGVLTPDQYVIFLENAYVNGPAKMAPRDGKAHKGAVKGAMKGHDKKVKGDARSKAKADGVKAKAEKKAEK